MTSQTHGPHGVTVVLLSVHVVAAIVLIGPITVAASLFPRYARLELAQAPPPSSLPSSSLPSSSLPRVTHALHRITAGYAVAALAVPVFGIGTAASLHVLGQYWLLISMALTAVAALILALLIVPAQRSVLAVLDGQTGDQHANSGTPTLATQPARLVLAPLLARLGMATGLFGLTWTAVVVLMIMRPGSTTGV